jgi:steroid delta-isomerase-like uncharacterized protein
MHVCFDTGEHRMSIEEMIRVLRRHVEAENAHDLDRTLETLHPDCLFEDVPCGQVYSGRSGAAVYYRKWWDAFALQYGPGEEGVRHITTEGQVVAEGRFFGHHRGHFDGLAPTGRAVDFRFAVVVSFREGLMADERFYYDRATLWQQLGVGRTAE